jgi:acetoacetyl-CoA synthetase
MWNWLVSALQTEATIVLYDGNPAHPDISTLWRIIAQHKIKVFGTSPKFLSACEKAQVNPGRDINLEHLSTILSTGSPLMPHHFDWIYSAVGKDIHLASISGGTDIISCFVLGYSTGISW